MEEKCECLEGLKEGGKGWTDANGRKGSFRVRQRERGWFEIVKKGKEKGYANSKECFRIKERT